MKSKEQKRKEAELRQLSYDLLSPAAKLVKLDREGHRALKERARLTTFEPAKEEVKATKKPRSPKALTKKEARLRKRAAKKNS